MAGHCATLWRDTVEGHCGGTLGTGDGQGTKTAVRVRVRVCGVTRAAMRGTGKEAMTKAAMTGTGKAATASINYNPAL